MQDTIKPIEEHVPEFMIDKDRLNNFYTGVIARLSGYKKYMNPEVLPAMCESFIAKHKVTTKNIFDGRNNYFTIVDKKNRVLGQMNMKFFII